jgi:hypothetical protein
MNLKLAPFGIARICSILVLFFILLTTTAAAAASVTLEWDPNNIAPEGYRVFARKSWQVYNYSLPAYEGAATTCTLSNLDEQTEYHFVVRAYHGHLESVDSHEVSHTTSGSSSDTTPPFWDGATQGIGLVTDTAIGGSVTVEFDTAKDHVDGRNLRANVYYAVSGSWRDMDWNLIADATVVIGGTFAHAVTVNGLTNGLSYTFGVRAEDQSGNEDMNINTLTATPTAVACELDPRFEQTTFGEGVAYYTDRNYIINGVVPGYLDGLTLIRTPNNERNVEIPNGYIRIRIQRWRMVYVLFDSRSASIPNWLSGWQLRTDDQILTSLATQPHFNIYEKLFAPGDCVDLGGNYAPGASNEVRSNFIVVYDSIE